MEPEKYNISINYRQTGKRQIIECESWNLTSGALVVYNAYDAEGYSNPNIVTPVMIIPLDLVVVVGIYPHA